MRFSQRIGITAVRDALQGRSLDETTRSRLWSALAVSVPLVTDVRRPWHRSWIGEFYEQIWSEFFKEPVDDMPATQEEIRNQLKAVILRGEWHEVYDLVEFTLTASRHANRGSYAPEVVRILREEKAGFRIMDGVLVEITDESELRAIEEAFDATEHDRFSPARLHLQAALMMLSDRRAPDYRNSIKESISAIEAIVRILSGDPSAELGKALKMLEKQGAPIHGAFRSALGSLYGYTSDADGIRHALTDEPNVDAADAKFMLVVCSAFVVYLIQKLGVQQA